MPFTKISVILTLSWFLCGATGRSGEQPAEKGWPEQKEAGEPGKDPNVARPAPEVKVKDKDKANEGTAVIEKKDPKPAQGTPALEFATFAGGCFWCMEPPFEKLEGVSAVVSGYTGGKTENPTYGEVCGGQTGHAEAVQVSYDPAKVTYRQLLNAFWRNIDPTQKNGQFVDHGTQYRTAIFYHSEAQREEAEESRKALAALGKFKGPVVTEIVKASKFYPAEKYHQDYYKTNEQRYQNYRRGSGREAFLDKTWGAKDDKK